MKKCVLILSLLMLSIGAVYARFHESYELYVSQDCYRHGYYTYCRPHRIHRHSNYRIYYPQTGMSVNIGNRHHSMSPVARSIYYPYRRNRGTISVNVAI